MDCIFHERQEGSLCAQHCLNTLLQGGYFSPVDLADLAQQLDESEREHMAVAGYGTEEYQHFINQPSSNFDDSGFFSIQVLQTALRVWNIELLPFNSSEVVCRQAREDPRSQQAYVCNFREHWFTVRRLGNQWFNMNSLLMSPELLSDTYLSLFLTQLQQEGYSIFVVVGELPPCDADEILRLMPAVQPIKPRLITATTTTTTTGNRLGHGTEPPESAEDAQLQRALEESRLLNEENDLALRQALEMSLEGFEVSDDTAPQLNVTTSTPDTHNIPDPDEVRRRRLAMFDKPTSSPVVTSTATPTSPNTTVAHSETAMTQSAVSSTASKTLTSNVLPSTYATDDPSQPDVIDAVQNERT